VTARLSLIAAVARNGVIGNGGQMPWRLRTDMLRFKAITLGKPVIMGRKTFESLGKPLAGRTNIVVTSRRLAAPEGVIVVPTIEAAVAAAAARSADGEAMVIGGGEIYAATIHRADRLYITHVEAAPDGDTRFPEIDPALWQAVSEEIVPAGENDSATTIFTIYQRRSRKETAASR
jgi:dihydrofolate reductase